MIKLENLKEKKQKKHTDPSVVDLFSGCGGLSYGFYLEGMEITTGVEVDQHACDTASYNLHWKQGNNKSHLCEDILEINANDLDIPDKSVITIGGPPCQAYSTIGKSKLRSLGEHRYGLNDERAFLYKEFIRLGLELDSKAIVMENVPASVNFLGMNIPEIVCNILEDNGYNAVWTILNAADFGVPQTRERVFVIGIRSDIGPVMYMPEPTHRNHAAEVSKEKIKSRYRKFNTSKHFKAPEVNEHAPEWMTVNDALSDLPGLFPTSDTKYILQRMNTRLPYQTPPINGFQREMRKQQDNNYKKEVDCNSFRRTLRDFRIFEQMEHGDDYRHASRIAYKLFREACEFYNVSKRTDEEAYNKLKKSYVPPYDSTKFHGKWKKMDPERPAHTLVAHLGTDTYSHIHPFEPRGISVREAARLQSFPDDFVFNVPMGSAFKQIGNAVPPLLAKGVAKAVLRNINQ